MVILKQLYWAISLIWKSIFTLVFIFSIDIYVCLVSFTHNVASDNHYIAMVSTTVETSNPEAELAPGLKLLGSIEEKFVTVSDIFSPVDGGEQSKVRSLCNISFFDNPALDVILAGIAKWLDHSTLIQRDTALNPP